MNKKIGLFLLIPLLGSALTSCGGSSSSSSEVGPLVLSYGEISTQDTGMIKELPIRSSQTNTDGLYDWVAATRSFVLIVTKKSQCGCWDDFEPIVSKANYEYNLGIRYIYYEDLPINNPFNIYVESEAKMPSICFFNKGVLTKQVLYQYENPIFKEYESFINFLKTNVASLPKRYMISIDDLRDYISEEKDFNLYVARTGCNDCGLMDTFYLNNWAASTYTVNDPLLIFDLFPYHPGRKPTAPKEDAPIEEQQAYEEAMFIYNEKAESYQKIKDEFGLSTKYNPVFGYDTGYVPTFQRRESGFVSDMITTLNDTIDVESKKVTNTYFTSSRVNAMPCLSNVEGRNKFVLEGKEIADYTKANSRIIQYREHFEAFQIFFQTYVK